MNRNEFIVGLDIGTTRVEAIIAEVDSSRQPKIVGAGSAPSTGLKKGVVVNLEKTVQAIKKAVSEAERMSGVSVKSAYVGVGGEHIRSVNSRGVVAVSRADNEITSKDVDRVLEAAQAVSIPSNKEIIHVISQEYIVEDQAGIKDPIGMSGVRLEAEVHIVTAAITTVQNLVTCVKRAGITVRNLVLEPLASSMSVLKPDEQELGCVMLDMGGGTTDVAVFFEGSIRHSAVIALGGNNITSDVAIGLRTPIRNAEEIKINHGCALNSLVDEDESLEVMGPGGRPPREVSRKLLASVIEPRVEELFELALREIKRTDYVHLLAAGIVLTGGSSLMPGMQELAENVFNLPVRLGVPEKMEGLQDQVEGPSYATGTGLILWGMGELSGTVHSKAISGERYGSRFIEKVKHWFKDIAD